MAGECQVCGSPAVQEAIVEGARVYLCEQDLHYGKPIFKERQTIASASAARQDATAPRMKNLNVVADYGNKVKHARESLGLTRKQLANTLFISENVLERIEDETLKPDHNTAEKLERFLKIKIVEEEKPEQQAERLEDEVKKLAYGRNKEKDLTLADIIDIKVKEKK